MIRSVVAGDRANGTELARLSRNDEWNVVDSVRDRGEARQAAGQVTPALLILMMLDSPQHAGRLEWLGSVYTRNGETVGSLRKAPFGPTGVTNLCGGSTVPWSIIRAPGCRYGREGAMYGSQRSPLLANIYAG